MLVGHMAQDSNPDAHADQNIAWEENMMEEGQHGG